MSTTDGRTELFALLLGGTALILALVPWLLREPVSVPAPDGRQGLEELRNGQADLQQRIEELEAHLRTMQVSNPDQRLPVQPAVPADFTARLEALETEAAESAAMRRTLERFDLDPGLVRLLGAQLTPEGVPLELGELRVQAMDPSLGEQERLQTLRQLRTRGEGARNGEVALALIDMAMRSQDPSVRADVWRQMSGAKDPALVQPLLQCLAGDLDAEVRHEAAETLGDFKDRPGVRAALEYAMNSDTSEAVRREAQTALGIR
jgi:hypothetical protein